MRRKRLPDAKLAEFEQRKRGSVGQLLLKCARLLDERAVARANRATLEPRFRPAHTKLFPHIDFTGVRLTELAERLGITKQAVGQLVGDLTALDILELVPDPSDGRAKLVRYTERGLRALNQGLGVLAEIESELEKSLGSRRMRELHETLLRLETLLSTGSAPGGDPE